MQGSFSKVFLIEEHQRAFEQRAFERLSQHPLRLAYFLCIEKPLLHELNLDTN